MTWPITMPLLTVTSTATLTPSGAIPKDYSISFRLSVGTLIHESESIIRRPIILAAVENTGVISGQVPWLSHADLSPSGAHYHVTRYVNGAKHDEFDWAPTGVEAGGVVDLDTVVPLTGDPGTPVAVGPPGYIHTRAVLDTETAALDADAASALRVQQGARYAARSANLSDLASAATARTNLGLGDSATKAVGTAAGTVAAGNDSRITGALAATGLDTAATTLVGTPASALAVALSSMYGVTATDSPTAPPEGQARTYWVTSAVSWPAGIAWSTDPDGGAAPGITFAALVSLATVGGVTYGVGGATFSERLISYVGSATTGTDAAVHTYAGVSFGAESANRVIVVAISAAGASSARTITGVTIGGITATLDKVTSGVGNTAIARATVPTGLTGTVVLTFSATVVRSMIGVYCAPATLALAATAVVTGAGADIAHASAAITNPAGGTVISAAYTHSTAVSWSANVTVDYSTAVETTWGTSSHTTTPGALVITPGLVDNLYDSIATVAYVFV